MGTFMHLEQRTPKT